MAYVSNWTAYRGSTINIWMFDPDETKNKFVQLRGSGGSGIKQVIANPKAGGFAVKWQQCECSGNTGHDPYKVKVFSKKGSEEKQVYLSHLIAGFSKMDWTRGSGRARDRNLGRLLRLCDQDQA